MSNENIGKDSKGNDIEFHILENEIKRLRPLSVLEGKAWILVYQSAEMKVRGKKSTVMQNNFPFFVTSKKEVINALSPDLKQKYLTPEFAIGERVRWHMNAITQYRKTNVKCELKPFFESMVKTVGSRIELKSSDYLNVFALWSIGTYFYRLFEFYPMLDFIGSKGSGKTKALSVLGCLCYNAIMSHKISGPFWARAVEASNGTILIDEQEELMNPKTEHGKNLRMLLHYAFKTNAQAPILIQNKSLGWVTKWFDVGVPVALGHINMLNDVTADRVIPMQMVKSLNQTITDNEVKEDDPVWWVLRDGCHRSFLDYYEEVVTISKIPWTIDGISGREKNQLWKPILVLARLFERRGIEGLVKSVLRVIKDTHEIKTVTNQSQNLDYQIIEYLSDVIPKGILRPIDSDKNQHWYQQEDLLKMVHRDLGLQYLSSRSLGSILDRLDIPRQKKNPFNLCFFVTVDMLRNIRERYNLDSRDFQADSALSAEQDFDAQSASSDLNLIEEEDNDE